MSIKKTFNGAAFYKPGAYTKIVVENLTGFPLSDTGTVGIVGEAKGGEPHVLDIIAKEQIQSAKARYKSGPIADALELLVNPSKDPRIANGASKIVIYKTNASTQSQVMLKSVAAVDKFKAKSKNFGADENQVSIMPTIGSIADAQAKIAGTVDGPFTVAVTDTLKLKVNGSLYTFTCSLTGSQTAAALMANMNSGANWAPSMPVDTTLVGQKIVVTLKDSVAKLDAGSILVDVTSTLDTILGITGSARGVKGARSFVIKKGLQTEMLPEVGGQAIMSVKYTGASCLFSIVIESGKKVLKTTTDVPANDLAIDLVDAEGRNLHTMQSLVDLISAKSAYVVSVLNSAGLLNASQLDLVDDVEIADVAYLPHRDDFLMVDQVSLLSQFVMLESQDVAGALEILSVPAFLAGAVDGVSANVDFVNAFEAMKEERINSVVPLISEDVGALTIDSINAIAQDHAAWGWSTTGKSERHAFVSKSGSKEQFKTACKNLNSGYVSVVGQEVQVRNNLGDFVWMKPWGLACILAGLRAGAEVGEPLTYKFINVNGIRVADNSWNPRKDFNEMIDAGCWIVEPMDNGGFRTVVGNTSYGIDPSFVWNRESVVQAVGYIAYDLRFNLELEFTGKKAKTGTATAIANFIKARMTRLLAADIIVGDDLNEGLGYYAKTMSVVVEGNTAAINLAVTPVQGVDFILPTIYINDIKQSA